MDWLTDNPIVNMPGPNFLGFYALVSLIVLLAFNVLVRSGETNQGALPSVPMRPDPYEIAYLRGGVGAVISLAIYSLKRSQTIEMQAKGQVTRVPGLGPPANPLEARVLEELGGAPRWVDSWVRATFAPRSSGSARRSRQHLARQDLVMTDAARNKARGLGSPRLSRSAASPPSRSSSRNRTVTRSRVPVRRRDSGDHGPDLEREGRDPTGREPARPRISRAGEVRLCPGRRVPGFRRTQFDPDRQRRRAPGRRRDRARGSARNAR